MAQVPPEPRDDASILDSDRLLRRIFKQTVYRSPDGQISRPYSGAFKTKKGVLLSVYVERLLNDRGLAYEDVLVGHEDTHLLIAFTAGQVRALGLGVALDPDPSDGPRGEAHAVLTSRLGDEARDTLAQQCEKPIWD